MPNAKKYTFQLPIHIMDRAKNLSVLKGKSVTSLVLEGLTRVIDEESADTEELIAHRVSEIRRSLSYQPGNE